MTSDTAPNSRDWSANENGGGTKPEIVVTGCVEVSALNLKPVLERGMQGISPAILVLDLVIVDNGGVGGQQVNWQDVRYQEAADHGTFSDIVIHWQNTVLAAIKVETG